MTKLTILAIPAIVLTASRVDAEPCAQRAAKLLAEHSLYVTYCARCGDKVPGVPARTSDGGSLDPATTYVQVSPYRYANLAALAGCPEPGIAPSLRVDGETPNGVLIYADSEPVVPAPAPEPPLPPIVVASPPQIVQVATPAPDDSWWRWIGAGAAGSFGSLAIVAVLARRKRHRARIPRALGLVADARDDDA